MKKLTFFVTTILSFILLLFILTSCGNDDINNDYAFGYCINLDYLEIGSGLEEVLGDYSFYYCTSLNTIFFNGDVSDFELIKPTYGDWYEYSGLETIICNDADLSLS